MVMRSHVFCKRLKFPTGEENITSVLCVPICFIFHQIRLYFNKLVALNDTEFDLFN